MTIECSQSVHSIVAKKKEPEQKPKRTAFVQALFGTSLLRRSVLFLVAMTKSHSENPE